ncbi:hypothetical protein DICPUDRAFT_73554 [Dictyostelium purpureum]|uniref:Uncharacterized protein n=1 Tax=Dictyostelium purpureum TaxID=5786 RepID=F1A1X5_DICPU|nr:uncharacterized protein DICPUDRAFT_73554 [Dictyostelium purpureum]EGC29807.1 hypothetical protein DICPUDRAFT_73554 [Dictyostelium purpureum]|eukprot:XP_003293672.1 hypothetical protein DICPUDRAFT_73554 [Dictyostelium purpureum]
MAGFWTLKPAQTQSNIKTSNGQTVFRFVVDGGGEGNVRIISDSAPPEMCVFQNVREIVSDFKGGEVTIMNLGSTTITCSTN